MKANDWIYHCIVKTPFDTPLLVRFTQSVFGVRLWLIIPFVCFFTGWLSHVEKDQEWAAVDLGSSDQVHWWLESEAGLQVTLYMEARAAKFDSLCWILAVWAAAAYE